MRVYISSGKHVGQVSKRVNTINQHLESPDVVFTESGDVGIVDEFKSIARTVPVAPLIAFASVLHLFICIRLFGWVAAVVTQGRLGKDRIITQRIAGQHEATIREIDTFYSATPIFQNPILWGIANWGVLVLAPTILWIFSIPFRKIILTGILLLSGFILLSAMLDVVNEDREKRMVTEILSEADITDSACVVIGKNHHSGVGKRLISHKDIDVINPTRGDTN
jgi:hypothetical protein